MNRRHPGYLTVINGHPTGHGRTWRSRGLARLSTLLVALSAGFAYAQSGTPDPAFGTNGRVLSHFGSAYNEAFAVADTVAEFIQTRL